MNQSPQKGGLNEDEDLKQQEKQFPYDNIYECLGHSTVRNPPKNLINKKLEKCYHGDPVMNYEFRLIEGNKEEFPEWHPSNFDKRFDKEERYCVYKSGKKDKNDEGSWNPCTHCEKKQDNDQNLYTCLGHPCLY